MTSNSPLIVLQFRAIAAAAERIAAESGGGGKVMGMVTGKTEGRVGRTPSEKGRAKM